MNSGGHSTQLSCVKREGGGIQLSCVERQHIIILLKWHIILVSQHCPVKKEGGGRGGQLSYVKREGEGDLAFLCEEREREGGGGGRNCPV